jgi:hypothetical protein
MTVEQLPEVVRRYQEAHDRHDTDAALAVFTADATVVDDGHRYVGASEIRTWLDTASREFTFTRTLVAAEQTGADRWMVTNHLEGDFPGGEVDLGYAFTLVDDRIVELVIAP